MCAPTRLCLPPLPLFFLCIVQFSWITAVGATITHSSASCENRGVGRGSQTRVRKIRHIVDVKNRYACARTYLSCPPAASQGHAAMAANICGHGQESALLDVALRPAPVSCKNRGNCVWSSIPRSCFCVWRARWGVYLGQRLKILTNAHENIPWFAS